MSTKKLKVEVMVNNWKPKDLNMAFCEYVWHANLTLIQWFVKLSLSLLFVVSFLATTSADTTVNIWQTADFSLKKTLKETNQRWVWDCAFSEDSQYLITGTI